MIKWAAIGTHEKMTWKVCKAEGESWGLYFGSDCFQLLVNYFWIGHRLLSSRYTINTNEVAIALF